MIDLIYRSKVPGYKGTKPTTAGRTGFLSGLWCYLFGGGAVPAYRTTGPTGGATAPTAPRCWWSLAGSPQYKAPPEPTPEPGEPEPEVPPSDGDPTGEDCGCEPPLGPEIHIFPGE